METPATFIPLDRRRALATGTDLPASATGAALFADISGFTPLTEALARAFGPRKGAEELTHHLNRVYSALIRQVHCWDGSVIGFSGDAITCWFSDRPNVPAAALRASHAAWAMQAEMTAFAAIEHPQGAVSLALKTAVAAGRVFRFVVGDPQIQQIDVLAGGVLERMATAEQAAGQGELVLDAETVASLSAPLSGVWRRVGDARFFVVSRLPPAQPPPPAPPVPPLPEDRQRSWLLPALYERLRTEEGRFLAELRPATALFLKFSGLDFEQDPDTPAKLDAYIRWVQAIVARFEGALIQLTTGDKGSYLYIAFGAPVAHDDDTLRAVATALALRRSPAQFDFLASVQMGLSQGRMRVGPYGSDTRRTYGVLGDEVNLAARLMSRAGPGEILLSGHVAQQVSGRYRLTDLGRVSLKGKAEEVAIFRLEGAGQPGARGSPALYSGALVGREQELAQALAPIRRVASGQGGQVIRLIGEAGVGKSHFATAVLGRAQRLGLRAAVGSCQSTERSVAYGPLGPLFRQLLDLPPLDTPNGLDEGAAVARLRAQLTGLDPDGGLLPRLPLLGDLLGLAIADTPTTAGLEPQLRQEALLGLALEIVRRSAARQPLLLLVEDIHWVDEASWRLLTALAGAVAEMACVLLLSQRPSLGTDALPGAPADWQLPGLALTLEELAADGIARLIANRLGGPASPLLTRLIQAKAQGNPFFTEEFVDALGESGLIRQEGGQWHTGPALLQRLQDGGLVRRQAEQWQLLPDAPLAGVNLGLPDSIHGIILSRLDRLPEEEKLTVKVASVIGRVFPFDLLAQAHPARPQENRLRRQIETLNSRDFARLEAPPPQLAYIFKHNITQEVVYNTLLDRQQQELHQAVAQELERLRPDAVAQLAFHYRHTDLTVADLRGKAVQYLSAAGAKAQREYANETALSYFERALALEMRWQWLAAKVELLHILGRREEERAGLELLAGLPDADAYRVQMLWGQYFEAVSDYPQALAAMGTAAATAEEAGSVQRLVSALGRQGLIHWRQGHYEDAAQAYEQALSLLAGTGGLAQEEAEIRYGLGILHRQQGQFDAAQAELGQALALSRQLENRPDEAKTLAALATVAHLHRRDYAASQAYNQQALEIRRAIGDRSGEGASLLALAQSARARGRYDRARALLTAALQIQRALGNRYWEVVARIESGIVLLLLGQLEAAASELEEALAISREIQSDVGVAYSLHNLGQVRREQGRLAAAHEILQEGRAIAAAQDDRYLEGQYYSDLALVAYARQEFAAALAFSAQALAICQALKLEAECVTEYTTHARAALGLGQSAAARNWVEQALQGLDTHSQEELEFCHREFWFCGQVLAALGEPDRARQARQSARRILLAKAALITDGEMRGSFLENVPCNRAILQASRQGSPASA